MRARRQPFGWYVILYTAREGGRTASSYQALVVVDAALEHGLLVRLGRHLSDLRGGYGD